VLGGGIGEKTAVVECIGGKVGVESDVGEGGRFWVELLLAGAEAEA
jgi:signal transduction histidine kinase